MSSKNGAIEVSFEQMKQGLQASPEQAKQVVQAIQAVNLDEVVNETIEVKVREHKEEPLFYDDGEPVLDKQGNPRMRRVPRFRTAHIQNIVPIDIYQQAMAISQGFQGGMPGEKEISAMGDMVLKIWQISEEWVTRKELIEDGGIDGAAVMALFARFFNKESPLQSA